MVKLGFMMKEASREVGLFLLSSFFHLYISEFEKELVALAESKHMNGIICGHIHQAARNQLGRPVGTFPADLRRTD